MVVDSADGGVGAYDFTVSMVDPSVASISDVAVNGNPNDQTTDVSIPDDGSSADVTVALANTSDTGSVTIATVTVQGDEAGTSDIGLAVDALGTEAGEPYTVTGTTGASITVEAVDDGDGDDSDESDDVDEEFTLDEIAQAKYGHDFADLSAETAGDVQAIYNRQPFPAGTEPGDIRTRNEITDDRYDRDFDDVSRETTIEIQNDYDAQFEADT